jgi:hypothetical protein
MVALDVATGPISIDNYRNENGILFNPLNAELNPIRHLLALAGARHFVHVSRIRVNGVLAYPCTVQVVDNCASNFVCCIQYIYT